MISGSHRNTIPVLIDHHNAQEHAKCEEEKAIDVVLDGVADRHAEGEHDDLGDSEEGGTEDDVANRPAVL